MEFLEVVTFIYPFSLKAGSSVPSTTRIYLFNTASLDIMCSYNFFQKNPAARSSFLNIYKNWAVPPPRSLPPFEIDGEVVKGLDDVI